MLSIFQHHAPVTRTTAAICVQRGVENFTRASDDALSHYLANYAGVEGELASMGFEVGQKGRRSGALYASPTHSSNEASGSHLPHHMARFSHFPKQPTPSNTNSASPTGMDAHVYCLTCSL